MVSNCFETSTKRNYFLSASDNVVVLYFKKSHRSHRTDLPTLSEIHSGHKHTWNRAIAPGESFDHFADLLFGRYFIGTEVNKIDTFQNRRKYSRFYSGLFYDQIKSGPYAGRIR